MNRLLFTLLSIIGVASAAEPEQKEQQVIYNSVFDDSRTLAHLDATGRGLHRPKDIEGAVSLPEYLPVPCFELAGDVLHDELGMVPFIPVQTEVGQNQNSSHLVQFFENPSYPSTLFHAVRYKCKTENNIVIVSYETPYPKKRPDSYDGNLSASTFVQRWMIDEDGTAALINSLSINRVLGGYDKAGARTIPVQDQFRLLMQGHVSGLDEVIVDSKQITTIDTTKTTTQGTLSYEKKPDLVEMHRREVTCTERTEQGNNYTFFDRIIHYPIEEITLSGTYTTDHTARVTFISVKEEGYEVSPFIQDGGKRIPVSNNREYRMTYTPDEKLGSKQVMYLNSEGQCKSGRTTVYFYDYSDYKTVVGPGCAEITSDLSLDHALPTGWRLGPSQGSQYGLKEGKELQMRLLEPTKY